MNIPEVKSQNLTMGIAGFILVLGVIYGATYVVGKAWQKSQQK